MGRGTILKQQQQQPSIGKYFMIMYFKSITIIEICSITKITFPISNVPPFLGVIIYSFWGERMEGRLRVREEKIGLGRTQRERVEGRKREREEKIGLGIPSPNVTVMDTNINTVLYCV